MEDHVTKLHEKTQGNAKQAVGQIVGDDKMVQKGKEQVREAEKSKGHAEASKGVQNDNPTSNPDEKSKTFLE
jgi:uncharacterized protein YjbJ (UPF0337 family)